MCPHPTKVSPGQSGYNSLMSSRASQIDQARVFSAKQILFPSLSYSSFAYPGDQEALAALSKVPGAPALLTYIQKNLMEEITHAENSKHMIRVGERNYPSIYKLVRRCAEILSVAVPDIYVTTKHDLNSYTMGQRRTSLVLHSGLIEAMNADELSFVIAHELGHIKCGHGLYRQLGGILIESWDVVASMIPIPGLGLLRIPLLLAYWEWFQRAELSCDRAGLLCMQTLNPVLSGLGKLAGHVHGLEEEFHVDSVVEQTNVHTEVNKVAMVISILNNATNTHPFIPFRLKQAIAYNGSPEYQNIMSGS
jgi:Zn-dependent protease with chaperone function